VVSCLWILTLGFYELCAFGTLYIGGAMPPLFIGPLGPIPPSLRRGYF
jgi:hypothetical protein